MSETTQEQQQLYNQIVSGNVSYQSYSSLLEVVRRIMNVIPELSIKGGKTIDNLSQKELEAIVQSFIIKLQKHQITQAKKQAKFGGNLNEINAERKIKAQQNWDSFYQDYYEEHKNNIKDLPQILNNGNATESAYQKIYNVFYALDIYKDVIYNTSKQRFEVIYFPDLKSGGTNGLKLTLPIFKAMIDAKIGNRIDDYNKMNVRASTTGNPSASTVKKLDYFDQFHSIFKGQKLLHPNVKQTKEYKYFIKMIQYLNLQRKYRKLNRFMGRSINKKVKPPLAEISDSIFNKFKQFGKRNLGRLGQMSNQAKIDSELYNQDLPYDPMKPIALKYGDVKVTDNLQNVEQKYRQQNQSDLSNKLLSTLPYIPDGDNVQNDIFQTANYRQRKGGYLQNQIKGTYLTNNNIRSLLGRGGVFSPAQQLSSETTQLQQTQQQPYIPRRYQGTGISQQQVIQKVQEFINKAQDAPNQEKKQGIAKKTAQFLTDITARFGKQVGNAGLKALKASGNFALDVGKEAASMAGHGTLELAKYTGNQLKEGFKQGVQETFNFGVNLVKKPFSESVMHVGKTQAEAKIQQYVYNEASNYVLQKLNPLNYFY